MTKSSPKKLDSQTWLTGEYVIYWGLIWAIISSILYLTYSVVDPQTTRPAWFILTTTGLEEVGLLISGCLCLRNWRSSSISGGTVWLLFAIAIFAFFGGNMWFCLWEMVWGLNPAASAGNLFFVLFYLILIAGMRLAILERDVQLARQQWVIVAGVAAIGLTMGCWLTTLSARAVTVPQQSGVMTIAQAASRGTMVQMNAPTIPPQGKIASSKLPPDWVVSIDRSIDRCSHLWAPLIYSMCSAI